MSLILIHVDVKNNRSMLEVARELRRIGDEIMGALNRRTDIVALYRKRQIVILLPETDPRGANVLVNRYRMMFPDNGNRLGYSVMTMSRALDELADAKIGRSSASISRSSRSAPTKSWCVSRSTSKCR